MSALPGLALLVATWPMPDSPRWLLKAGRRPEATDALNRVQPEVDAEAGFHTPAEQAAATTWSIGVVNALATLIAIAFVDRLGRRPLLLAGLTGMTVGLVLVGLGFHLLGGDDGSGGESLTGVMTLAGLVVFVASFAFS